MSKTEKIVGFHAVNAILKTRPNDVMALTVVQSNRKDQRLQSLLQLARAANIVTHEITSAQVPTALQDVVHQGVFAEAYPAKAWDEHDLQQAVEQADKPVVLLFLDEVQDPHNLGACLRSANALGVLAVVVPKDRSVKITEVVKKVASGAAEHTPLVTVTNLQRTIKNLQALGVWFVGLDGEADTPIADIDLTGNIAIVMGSEGQGLRRLTREVCDYLAKIPMQGAVESLNVSVATAITLYEVQRQR